MGIIKKITILLLVFTIITSVFNVMSYEVWADNFNLNAFEEEVASAAGMQNLVNDTSITIISIMRIACITIAIVILLVIAMKYMMSAPGDRADIKKHAIHYVIGAFILFAVTGILSIIDNFAKHIK